MRNNLYNFYIKVLDLTLNSLHFVPDALPSLVVLRKLMLGSNPFVEVVFSKVIPSIQYLSLSSCKLKKVPDFAALPGLLQLNLSDNQISVSVFLIFYFFNFL